MPKMLAFIDGSIYSDSVCDHVIWAAAGDQFDVSLFNVIEGVYNAEAPSNFSGNLGAEAKNKLLIELSELDQKRAKLAQKKARLVLDLARERLIEGGIKTVETHLRNGDFVDTVTEFQDDSDIIVIGKRGEAANFAKMHLGSNLERLIRSTNKPVLVAARAFKPVKRILVAFDGGRSSYGAIEYIASNRLYSTLNVISSLPAKTVAVGINSPHMPRICSKKRASITGSFLNGASLKRSSVITSNSTALTCSSWVLTDILGFET
jgi:nucleotide-binding universal stress UspA family protein